MSSTCGESQIKKHQISSSLISHRHRCCCCVVVVDATLMVLLLLLLILILMVLLELNGYWCCCNVHGGDAIEYFLSVVVSVVLLLRCCHKDLWYLNHNLIFSRFRFLHRNRCCCCYQCYVFNSWYLLIVVALNALCEPLLMLLFLSLHWRLSHYLFPLLYIPSAFVKSFLPVKLSNCSFKK